MIKCAILDLDGTIADSMGYWINAANDVVLKLGLVPDDNLSTISMSMSLVGLSEYLIKRYNLSYTIDEVCDMFDDCMLVRYENDVKIKPYFYDLIVKLKEMGIKMAVASSTSKPLVEVCLKRLKIDGYFEYVADAREIGKSKQFPDIYMKCSDYFGIRYDESIIFEDLPYGIICTKKYGFKTVAFYDKTNEKHTSVLKENADLYIENLNIDSLGEIVDFINHN